MCDRMIGGVFVSASFPRESMWTDGSADVWRSEAMSLEVKASKNSVEEKRREALSSADSLPRIGG